MIFAMSCISLLGSVVWGGTGSVPEVKEGITEVDEVVLPSWVIPVDTDKVLSDHAVIVDAGRIVDVMPADKVATQYSGRKTTSLPGKALIPGFVNAHTHTPMVLLRGVSDDIRLRQWLETVIWPLEHNFVDEEFVREGAELAILEMILGGVTTFNDMYWFPESLCEAIVKSGIRAAVGIITIDFPFGKYGTGPDDYFSKGKAAREKFLNEPNISWTVSAHAPFTCSDASLEKVRDLSNELNCPVHIHVHETEEERVDSIAGNRSSMSCHQSDEKCSPVANLRRLKLLNERLIAVHMVWLSDEEISWCAEAKASVVHCPTSNLKLASGFCRVSDLMKAGVNVALGTDGASSNNTLDLMAEMKLAAILAKAVGKDAEVVPAITALRMATLNGAKALGISKVTGSITVGKDADMIAIDLSGPSLWPSPTLPNAASPSMSCPIAGFDPVSHIVYAAPGIK